MIVLPLVGGSLVKYQPIRHYRLWVGLYGGFISYVLVMISIEHGGFTYDIRYAPIILAFAYFGPMAGIITGTFALLSRLIVAGEWAPALVGWLLVIVALTACSIYFKRTSSLKRCSIFYCAYVVIYLLIVMGFNILLESPMFHFEYVIFVLLGVIVGGMLIESYAKLFRVNRALTSMYHKVEESEFKYRLIAENTSDLIKVINKDYNITYLSPSHEAALGYKLTELDRMDLSKIFHVEDFPAYLRAIEHFVKNRESGSLEFRLCHKNGQWIDFESRCVPVEGKNGEVEYIVFISRDVSERKKAEEILLQSEKLSIVGELAAGVAHEIRNPLTTIKGFVQLNKGMGSYHEILLSELNRIEAITSELLALGKPQAVQLSNANVHELLLQTIEIMSPQALMNNIQFKYEVEKDTPFYIHCEKNQMKQVLLNVFKNAIEAMENGGEIHVTLCKNGDGECVISVQDQGCGIPEELLPRLGEPFYTLKEKGTGLGIMICHKIIKQHNGQITYKSKVDKGTTVEINLPLISA